MQLKRILTRLTRLYPSTWRNRYGAECEALQVLIMMGPPDSKAELQDIRDSLHLEVSRRQASLLDRLHGRLWYSKPMLLAIAIGSFNQLSGSNAFFTKGRLLYRQHLLG